LIDAEKNERLLGFGGSIRQIKTPARLACVREACRTGDCLDCQFRQSGGDALDLFLFRCFLFGFFLSSHLYLLARVEEKILCPGTKIVNNILSFVREIANLESLSPRYVASMQQLSPLRA
jgi:hypothetical protein